MPDTTTVIRWRNRRNRFSRWHLPVSIPADDSGQTACGLRFERKRSETGTLADGEMCRRCLRAQQGTVPGEPCIECQRGNFDHIDTSKLIPAADLDGQ